MTIEKVEIPQDIYQLKVTLRFTRPPIWRRLLVPATLTLEQLHDVLQTAMGWDNGHMHEFRIGDRRFGTPDPEDQLMGMPRVESERTARLSNVLQKPRAKLTYTYDFGDGWEHSIVLEKRLAAGPEASYPVCTGGQLACPPEDCGGVPGYYDLIEAIADPDHQRHEEIIDWVGEDFDPKAFSVEKVNRRLSPKPLRGKASKKSPAKKKVSASPAGLEAAMRQLEEMLVSSGMATPGDLNALMTSLAGPSASDGLSDTEADARNEAQQVAFEAMEANSAEQARKLAKRALRLDPDCVDALVVLADLDAPTQRELMEALQKAVAAGERSLGEKFIRENKGHFWLLLETRPYMRAMEMLAGLLHTEGFNLDAIKVYERMLELNPNDNQGVRDPLLGLYLETGDLKSARELLEKFKEDASANFAWARVLERFLAGKSDEASAALKEARRANRHVELYLAARKPLPDHLPEMYSLGSEEEATLCVGRLSGAWAAHKEALVWLLDQLAMDGLQPVLSEVGGRPISRRVH